MPETLIVTNGDIAAARLAEAAPDASVLPWRDMLHDGPVPADLPLRILSGLRARWLAQEVDLERAEVEATFLARDLRFALVEPGSEVILCLEHDLYDQLQLIQLLAELAPRAGRYTVTLAQADDHLGSQEPASLAALLARRRPASDTALAAGTALWAAFRATTPEASRNQKALMNRWERVSVEEGIYAGIDALAQAYQTGEPQAAIKAFFEAKAKKG